MEDPDKKISLNKSPKPLNRKERRRLAKQAHVPMAIINSRVPRRAPAYLGIKKFKKMGGGDLTGEYKDHAWRSLHEYNDRLRTERLQREGKTPDSDGSGSSDKVQEARPKTRKNKSRS